jgi:hypothetical protein
MAGPNPFGDNLFEDVPTMGPAQRIRHSASKIRRLRQQVGHDGLSPASARTLLDELSNALDAMAKAIDPSDEPELKP